MSVEELRISDPECWVVKRTNLADERANDWLTSIKILVTAHHNQLLFLESCLKSLQGLGWIILLYDNPTDRYEINMPKERHYKLINQFCMKYLSREIPGPTYPQFWHYRNGMDLILSTNTKYVFTIGADCILERPEGLAELLKILGDGDILSSSTKNIKHGGPFCGTKSFIATKEAFRKIVDYLQTLFVPFKDIGNMETRFGMAIRDLQLKEVIVPELPADDQFAHSYDKDGNCIERGTWGKILGFRHLSGEHKIRKQNKIISVEEKYFDKEYMSGFEKEVLGKYWQTKDMKILEQWWAK
jgi:hypothetical protein